MGADTSTLQSVESLSQSLSSIERKLTSLEEIYSRQDHIVSNENNTNIADNLIKTSPYVDIIIGPVIGLVTTTSVRLLLEISQDAYISFHFYEVDSQLDRNGPPRFLFEKTLKVLKNIPITYGFHDLLPDTNYIVHIGGVKPKDTIENYASFKTLPSTHGIKTPINLLVTRNSHSDGNLPGEDNVWESIERDVIESSSTLARNISHDQNLSIGYNHHYHYHHPTHPHMVLHNGNTVSFEDKIRLNVFELIEILNRPEVSIQTLMSMLYDIERIITECYRNTLTSSKFRLVLKRCGNIFVAGDQEAISDIISVLLNSMKTIPSDILDTSNPSNTINQTTSMNENENISENRDEDRENTKSMDKSQLENFLSSNEVKSASEADREYLQRYANNMSIKEKRSIELQRIYDQDSDYNRSVEDESRLTTNMEEMITYLNTKSIKQASNMSKSLLETKLAAAGLVARIARRVYWKYMRSLWDETCDQFIQEDEKIEEYLRSILIANKKMESLCAFYHSLQKTKVKLVNFFHASKVALKQLSSQSHTIVKEIKEKELEILNLYTSFESYKETCQIKRTALNSKCLNIGGILFLIIENVWDYFQPDGWIRSIEYSRIESYLDEEFSFRLDNILYYKESKYIPREEGSEEGNHENHSILATLSKEIIKNIIVISSSPILPSQVAYHEYMSYSSSSSVNSSSSSSNHSYTIPLCQRDCCILTKSLSQWQSSDEEYSVLIVMPTSLSNNYSSGWLVKVTRDIDGKNSRHEEDGDNEDEEEEDNGSKDNYDRNREDSNERGSLRTILLPMATHQTEIQSNSYYLHEYNTTDEQISQLLPLTDFEAIYQVDENSIEYLGAHRKSYFDIILQPDILLKSSLKSQLVSKPATIYVQHKGCSRQNNHNNHNNQNNFVLLGPIIGSIGTNYTTILVEFSISGNMELYAIDQITGVTYSSVQYVKAYHRTIFVFSQLLAGHCYSIHMNSIDKKDKKYSNSDISTLSLREYIQGSFTTLSKQTISYHTVEEDTSQSLLNNLYSQIPSDLDNSIDKDINEEDAFPMTGIQSFSNRKSSVDQVMNSIDINSTRTSVKQTNIVGNISVNEPSRKKSETSILSTRKLTTEDESMIMEGKNKPSKEDGNSVSITKRQSIGKSLMDVISIRSKANTSVRNPQQQQQQLQPSVRQSTKQSQPVTTSNNGNIVDTSKNEKKKIVIPIPSIVEHGTGNNNKSFHMIVLGSYGTNNTENSDQVINGLSMLQVLSNYTLNPFHPIHLIIHVGSTINLSPAREDILSYTAQLDTFLSSSNIIKNSNSNNIEKLCNRIENSLKLCYRMNWNNNQWNRNLLCNSSHMFLSNPILHLLDIFEVNSYAMLRRELSIETIDRLVNIVSKIDCSYQKDIRSTKPSYNNSSNIEYLNNDQIVLYTIQPNLLSIDTHGLIPEYQFKEIEDLCHQLQNSNCTTTPILFISSPIPMIVPICKNPISVEDSEIQYSSHEICRLLDVITNHYIRHSKNSNRITFKSNTNTTNDSMATMKTKIFILCSGPIGYTTDISIVSKNKNNSIDNESINAITIQQICVGPSIGSNTAAFSFESNLLNPIDESFEMKSKEYIYTCHISNTTTCPHINLIKTSMESANTIVETKTIDYTMLSDELEAMIIPIPNLLHRKGLYEIWDRIIQHLNQREIEFEEAFLADRSLSQNNDNTVSKAINNNNISYNEVALNMLRGLEKIINEKYGTVFNNCYDRYKSMDSYDTSSQSIEIFAQTISILLKQCIHIELPNHISAMLPIPSSLVIYMVFDLFVSMITSGTNRLSLSLSLPLLPSIPTIVDGSNSYGNDNNNDNNMESSNMKENLIGKDKREMNGLVLAMLRNDIDCFIKFIRYVLGAQILSEYFSHQQGQHLFKK